MQGRIDNPRSCVWGAPRAYEAVAPDCGLSNLMAVHCPRHRHLRSCQASLVSLCCCVYRSGLATPRCSIGAHAPACLYAQAVVTTFWRVAPMPCSCPESRPHSHPRSCVRGSVSRLPRFRSRTVATRRTWTSTPATSRASPRTSTGTSVPAATRSSLPVLSGGRGRPAGRRWLPEVREPALRRLLGRVPGPVHGPSQAALLRALPACTSRVRSGAP